MKLLISDMGGVVCTNTDVVPAICAYLGISRLQFYEIAGLQNLRLLLTGYITSHQFWAHFSKRSGLRIDDDLWKTFFDPQPEPRVVRLLVASRSRCRVVVGTNTFESHYQVHVERGHYAIFDAVYASHQMGFAKPNQRFFRCILKAERCPPEEAVFIDDVAEHVESARKVGMQGIVFNGVEGLARELGTLGLVTHEA